VWNGSTPTRTTPKPQTSKAAFGPNRPDSTRGIICRTGPLRRKNVLLLLMFFCRVWCSDWCPDWCPELVSRLMSPLVSRLVSRLIPPTSLSPEGWSYRYKLCLGDAGSGGESSMWKRTFSRDAALEQTSRCPDASGTCPGDAFVCAVWTNSVSNTFAETPWYHLGQVLESFLDTRPHPPDPCENNARQSAQNP
jgi:hypothetical protein